MNKDKDIDSKNVRCQKWLAFRDHDSVCMYVDTLKYTNLQEAAVIWMNAGDDLWKCEVNSYDGRRVHKWESSESSDKLWTECEKYVRQMYPNFDKDW